MTLTYIVDGLIILLLGVAIGYAYVLNQRLKLLRDSRGELERVVGSLAEAISQADAGLIEINNVAQSLGRDLDRKIDGARGHSGELEILVDRAESAASRLETAIGLTRKLDPGILKAVPDQPPAEQPSPRVVGAKPADERPAKPKARPKPAKLFVGPAEEAEEPLGRAAGGSIVKALRGMR